MPTFVARKGDQLAEHALRIISTTWGEHLTRVLPGQDGVAGPDEVAIFTGDGKKHWPSKWLRITQRQRFQNSAPPDWAKTAIKVIAIRPREAISEGDGFTVAVRDAASNLTGLKQPLPAQRAKRKPRCRHPHDHYR